MPRNYPIIVGEIKAKCLGRVDKLLTAIILRKYEVDKKKENIKQRRVYTILNASIFNILKFKSNDIMYDKI